MSLTVRSSFKVDAPRERVWAFLTDIERAAPCFPGAELGSKLEDGGYNGAFNVKLGPMSFRFGGKFGFDALEPEAGRLVVKATGADSKGRGSANARVQCELSEAEGGTSVGIVSSVDLSGAVAQYGRAAGMIEALSKQLIEQFAGRVAQALREEAAAAAAAQPAVEAAAAAPAEAPAEAPSPAPAPSRPQELAAGSLFLKALWAMFTGWIARLFGRAK